MIQVDWDSNGDVRGDSEEGRRDQASLDSSPIQPGSYEQERNQPVKECHLCERETPAPLFLITNAGTYRVWRIKLGTKTTESRR